MRRTREYTEFGLWLKMEMTKRNLTSKELAKMAGINVCVLCDVMMGRNQSHQEKLRQALEQYDAERLAV